MNQKAMDAIVNSLMGTHRMKERDAASFAITLGIALKDAGLVVVPFKLPSNRVSRDQSVVYKDDWREICEYVSEVP